MAKAYGTLRVWRSHTCLTGPQVIKEFYAMGPVWACVHEWLGLTVESPELKVLLLCVYGRTAWKQVVLASVRLFCLNFSQNWNYSRLTRSRGSEPASTKAGYTQSGVTPLLICLCFSCFDKWMPACWGRSCPKPHWSWDEILSGRLRENTCESLLRVLSAYKKTWTMITWGKKTGTDSTWNPTSPQTFPCFDFQKRTLSPWLYPLVLVFNVFSFLLFKHFKP